jgi:hypothetical protein
MQMVLRNVLFLRIDYLWYKKYLQITEDRRKRVIDLYFNQHKTYAEIAEIEKMSPRDIHSIVKEEESRQQKYKDQQHQEEISSKAYKLFSEDKRAVEVAIALNVKEPEVTKLFIEYCKLKRLHKFYFAYNELGAEGIRDFLKLYKLAKNERLGVEQVVKLLQLADEDKDIGLSSFEKGRKWGIDEIHNLDMQIEKSKKHLQSVNDEIASAKALLNSYHISCERKRQESVHLNNELSRLESFVSRFKNDNEEYLKIKKTVEEEVSKFLADGKVLLQFAPGSVIEALRRSRGKYNDLLVSNTLESSTSTPTQDSLVSYIESYKNMILDEANRLYDTVQNYLTNSIMENVTSASSSNPTLSLPK